MGKSFCETRGAAAQVGRRQGNEVHARFRAAVRWMEAGCSLACADDGADAEGAARGKMEWADRGCVRRYFGTISQSRSATAWSGGNAEGVGSACGAFARWH